MKKAAIILSSILTLSAFSPALASGSSEKCGEISGKWMSKETASSLAVEKGYTVKRVKREDGCFEIYATDNNGSRVELYMNPVTGDIVKTKKKS